VHPENSGLGGIENRGTEKRAVDPAVRNREHASLQIRQLDIPFSGSVGVFDDVFLDLGE